MKTYGGYVYLMTNKYDTVIYTGVTANLQKRVYQHKEKLTEGFTKKYNVHKLVYFEKHDGIISAGGQEKRYKNWRRKWKLSLIKSHNPLWKDLYEDIY